MNTPACCKAALLGREEDWDKPGVLVNGIDVATGKANTQRISAEEYFHGLFAYTERYVYDASYVKLRELRVSYNLPTSPGGKTPGRAGSEHRFHRA